MSITTGINILMVLLGILIGISIMYGVEKYIDWKEDQEEAKQEALARAFDHIHCEKIEPIKINRAIEMNKNDFFTYPREIVLEKMAQDFIPDIVKNMNYEISESYREDMMILKSSITILPYKKKLEELSFKEMAELGKSFCDGFKHEIQRKQK